MRFSFLGILILIVSSVYYVARPHLLPTVVVCFLIIFLCKKPVNWLRLKITGRKRWVIILILISIYLVFTYFNARLESSDGLNYSLRFASLVRDKGYVAISNEPVKPYFAEILMGLTWRYLGFRAMHVLFGIWTISAIFLCTKLLSILVPEDKEGRGIRTRSALLFFLSLPFLTLALYESKTDMFLACMVLLSLILLSKIYLKKSYKLFPLLSLALGIGILTKASVTPFAILTYISALFYIVKKVDIKKTLPFIALGSFVLLFIPVTYVTVFGVTHPTFSNLVAIKPLLQEVRQESVPKINLTRDTEILAECLSEDVIKDYSSFIYKARSPLVLLQPFFYLTGVNSTERSSRSLQDLGPFLYIGIMFTLFTPLIFTWKKLTQIQKALWIICFGSLLFFYYYVSSVYWYVFFLFPLASLTLFKVISFIEKEWIRKAILLFIYTSLLVNITIAVKNTIVMYSPAREITEDEIASTQAYGVLLHNKKLEELSKDGLILNASENKYYIPTPFMKDDDLKVITSRYYFASSDKSIEKIHDEMKQNNIKYITVDKNSLTSRWFEGCPKRNNEILGEYLEKYTTPVFYNDNVSNPNIFKINY